MKFMLDTNVCVDVMRGRNRSVRERLCALLPRDVCVSSITLSELEYGACKSSDQERNRLLIAEFMSPVDVMPYDDACAPHYGRVRADLERQGTPIGPLDTMIAAHALALNLTLVTNNEREFRRVSDLKVVNWVT